MMASICDAYRRSVHSFIHSFCGLEGKASAGQGFTRLC